MRTIRKYLIFILLILSTGLSAERIGQWSVYPSFSIATSNLAVENRIYALMDGNLMQYDTQEKSIKTYDRLNGLNDVRIRHINYSVQSKKLIIGYENGNIDLMDLQDNVYNLPYLKMASMAKKQINAIVVEGETAYVCTGFGFLTLDMREQVISETYNLGLDVTGIHIGKDKIYVSTSQNQVKSAPLKSNWKIIKNWQQSTDYQAEQIRYKPSTYNFSGGLYWKSEAEKGLWGYKRTADGDYLPVEGPIQPNSPIRDLFYRIQYVGDRLLVAGGINTPYAVFRPATAMFFQDGRWTHLDEQGPKEKYPYLKHYNTTHLVQDPLDDTHHFASPYRTGLYEYRNGKFVGLYNSENSPLMEIKDKGVPMGPNYVSAVALQFDADGNLWMANQQTDTIIRILTPQGKWYALYYPELANTPTVYDYLFTTSGVNFLISHRISNRGFFGFTTNGTLNTTNDDQHVQRKEFKNQDGISYKPDRFYCMAEDHDGKVWCGTNLGLFIIPDPRTYFDSDFVFQQIKIDRNDGSGLADYLLSDIEITCIAIDGANRKWIGTSTSGLYLLSPDGQQTIHHFQSTNSPLLSNNIQTIAIHPTSGLVMIGTDIGLCSYMSDATLPQETLANSNVRVYPNPIRPDYGSVVTIDGLMANTEVKICSSTGQLIHKGQSNGGRYVWNCTSQGGRRVSSGVYNVIASTPDSKRSIVARIIVVK